MRGHSRGYLRIDCESGLARAVPLPEIVLRKFLGGVGLGTYILYRESPPRADPLGAAAALVFAVGPLTASPIATSAKFAVCGKSPLTERICDSMASSRFALALKRAGWEAIALVGAARELSAIVVEDDKAWLLPAGPLAGLPAAEAERELHGWLGPDFQVAAIGPAGENRVRYATISHDGRHAARGGLGAVLGSKGIKAIAVRGGQAVEAADPERAGALAASLRRSLGGAALEPYRQGGTAINMQGLNSLGLLPARNFRQATFAGASELSPTRLGGSRRVLKRSCSGCQIGCERRYVTQAGAVRVEYQTLFALGPLCGVADEEVVLQAAAICDELGLDTMSAGATIAFAMELAERGRLHYPGLRFGNGAVLLDLLPLIAQRQGVGGLLAEGSRRVALEVGGDAIAWAPQVKGMELPGYEPRLMPATALGLAVGARGADHNRCGGCEVDFSVDGSDNLSPVALARRLVAEEDRAALLDSLILCRFARPALGDLFSAAAELLQAVAGWPADALELRRASRRIVALRRLFNLREGWVRAEDTLPARILDEPVLGGIGEGATLSAERLRSLIGMYYRARRWAPDGTIPANELRRLDLHLVEFAGAGFGLPERNASGL